MGAVEADQERGRGRRELLEGFAHEAGDEHLGLVALRIIFDEALELGAGLRVNAFGGEALLHKPLLICPFQDGRRRSEDDDRGFGVIPHPIGDEFDSGIYDSNDGDFGSL